MTLDDLAKRIPEVAAYLRSSTDYMHALVVGDKALEMVPKAPADAALAALAAEIERLEDCQLQLKADVQTALAELERLEELPRLSELGQTLIVMENETLLARAEKAEAELHAATAKCVRLTNRLSDVEAELAEEKENRRQTQIGLQESEAELAALKADVWGPEVRRCLDLNEGCPLHGGDAT